jgi:hypothetical protein
MSASRMKPEVPLTDEKTWSMHVAVVCVIRVGWLINWPRPIAQKWVVISAFSPRWRSMLKSPRTMQFFSSCSCLANIRNCALGACIYLQVLLTCHKKQVL